MSVPPIAIAPNTLLLEKVMESYDPQKVETRRHFEERLLNNSFLQAIYMITEAAQSPTAMSGC